MKFGPNTTRQAKLFYISLMFAIYTSLSLDSCSAVMLPIPATSIHTITSQPHARNLMPAKTQKTIRTAPVITVKVDKVSIKMEGDITLLKWIDGSISSEEAILQLRGGDLVTHFYELICVMFLIVAILNGPADLVDALLPIQLPPHMNPPRINPVDWRQWRQDADRPYNQQKSIPSSWSESQTTRTSTALQLSQNPTQTQISTFVENGNLDLKAAFNEVNRRASAIGCQDFDCSFERFQSLATENGITDFQSTREAISVLQGEMLGYYNQSERLNYGKEIKGPDFKVNGLGEYSHVTHVENKNPVGAAIKLANAQDPNINRQAKHIAAKIEFQKNFWSDVTKTSQLSDFNESAPLPQSPNNLLGVVDCYDVPILEKPLMQNTIMNRMNNDPNVIFLNNNQNI